MHSFAIELLHWKEGSSLGRGERPGAARAQWGLRPSHVPAWLGRGVGCWGRGQKQGAVVWVTLAVFLSVCERGEVMPTLPSPPQVPRPV